MARETSSTPRRAQVCTRANPWDAGCPSRQILSLVADKWVLLLLPLLENGPKRNAELARGVSGISQKMLAQTLRALEEHGLITRRDYGEVPPRVEYSLTPIGRSLTKTLDAVDEWVVSNFDRVTAARQGYRRRPPPSRVRGA